MSDSPPLWAPSATPLACERRLSPSLTLLVAAGHALAIAPLLWLPVPWFLALPWSALVLAAAAREFMAHSLPGSPRFVRRLHWGQDGRWRLETGDGRLWQAQAVAALASPRICIVHWRRPVAGSRSLVLPADALDQDSHRQLRRALDEALALRRRAPRPGAPA